MQDHTDKPLFPGLDNEKLEANTFTMSPGNISVIPLVDNVVFPMIPYSIILPDDVPMEIVESAQRNRTGVFFVCRKDSKATAPLKKDDLYPIGVMGHISRVSLNPDGSHSLFVMPLIPGKIHSLTYEEKDLKASIHPYDKWGEIGKSKQKEWNLTARRVIEIYKEIINHLDPDKSAELKFGLEQFEETSDKLKYILVNSPLSIEESQSLLSTVTAMKRINLMLSLLDKHAQEIKLLTEISQRSQSELTHQQKVEFLQRQIKTMQDEISGNIPGESSDFDSLNKRAEVKKWSDAARDHFKKELGKLSHLVPNSPDYSLQYAYLDTLLNLPWDSYSDDELNLSKVEHILNRDHYGLKEVKERILEQMAVIMLRNDMKAPILCLYGPPGVGKTSLGKSIAEAMGRSYARVSLGGVQDEVEIRGHRRTYIGAMPGRVIKALEKAGTNNPVIVLDEIDKIGNSYKGDPSSALLEVLDPEQNDKFHDNYVDFDYDLSKVLFIATANNLSTISSPLLDRMEVINISGYSTEEKIEIARRHLIPKSKKEHGLDNESFSFNRNAIEYVIEHYTRENGVRQLEKKINKILRKLAVKKARNEDISSKITRDSIPTYLGKEEVMPEVYETNDTPGVVTGLAWTSVGGDILFIESSLSDGKGEKLTLTGNLGNVMKESATIALQYIKSNAERFGIDKKMFETKDVHIHVPEGAIPKDGPSAGITMVTSLVSSFTGKKVREKTAMTGEITLRGKVLPVGGIKEKMLAARRAGIIDVVLSSANRKDIEEIPAEYLKGMNFHYVKTIDEVIDISII